MVLFLDLDGVIADFERAMNSHPLRNTPPYASSPDRIPHIFRDLDCVPGAKVGVRQLLNSAKYEVYFLSTAPWDNPSAWTDKRLWLEAQFGKRIHRRLILTHRKDLMKGDLLVDDRPNNGAAQFEGEWIHFGSTAFPDWTAVIDYLL